MKFAIQGALLIAAIVMSWLIYDSINSKLEFRKIAASREAKVVERLKDIRTLQIAYKSVKGEYSDSFDKLITFIRTDSMPYIKAIGNVPDTLTEMEAVQLGIVIRDTFKIALKDTLFYPGFPIDSIALIPYGGNEQFRLQAGEVEKNKVNVKVFEAFAGYGHIYSGLDVSNENVDDSDGLKVGSMTDATTTGNWE